MTCRLQRFLETVCSAMNSTETYKQMLPKAHSVADSLVLDHACNNIDLWKTLLHAETSSYYLWATKTHKHLNNCRHASTCTISRNYRWSRSCSSSNKLRWCQRRTQKNILDQPITFLSILKTFCLIYIHHCDSIIIVRWLSAYCSLGLFTTFLFLQHAIYLRSVEWSWCLLRCPELIQLVPWEI